MSHNPQGKETNSLLMQVVVKSKFVAARDGFLDAGVAPQLFHSISDLGIGESYIGINIGLGFKKQLAQWLEELLVAWGVLVSCLVDEKGTPCCPLFRNRFFDYS